MKSEVVEIHKQPQEQRADKTKKVLPPAIRDVFRAQSRFDVEDES
jgi:hypothetical protein